MIDDATTSMPTPGMAYLHRFVELVLLPAAAASEAAARRTVEVEVAEPLTATVHRVTEVATAPGASSGVHRILEVAAAAGPPDASTHRARVIEPPAALRAKVHRVVRVDAAQMRSRARRTVRVAAPPRELSAATRRTVPLVAPMSIVPEMHKVFRVFAPEFLAKMHRVVSVTPPFPSMGLEPRARSFEYTVRRRFREAVHALPSLSGFDVNGAPLLDGFAIVEPPQFGKLVLGEGGAVSYARYDPSWLGHDSFTYTVTSPAGLVSPPATVRLDVRSAAQMVVKGGGRTLLRSTAAGKHARFVVADRVSYRSVAATP